MVWYCHQCNRHVEIINDLKCPNCNGEFVEELEDRDSDDSGGSGRIIVVRNNAIEGTHPLLSLLAATTNSNPMFAVTTETRRPRVRTASGSTFGSENSQGTQEDPAIPSIMDFFQQLIGNLAEDYAPDGGIDNIVTHLLNQFENTGQTDSISVEDLHNLPMVNVNEKQVANDTQCATCMETFNLGENVASLDCQHIFHRPCIEPWLKKHNTCPICRKTVDPKKWAPKPVFTDIDELD